MNIDDIDFGGTSGGSSASSSNQGGNANTANQNAAQQEDTTPLNHGDDTDDLSGQKDLANADPNANKQKDDTSNGNNGNQKDDSSTGELSEGDTVEFEGVSYTVDATGNLVDDKGVIFKEAKDVAEWLKSVEIDDNTEDNSEINMAKIQEAIGTTVTDEEGKPIEFTNDIKGVQAYINSVIDLKSNELQQAAVNKLFAENPILKEFNDYVLLTGTPRGFGEIPDRSGITLNKDNEMQLISVIKMAANEFGNKSLNDNYIKFLKDTGGLYEEAKNQLAALQEKDATVRKNIETQAAAKRAQEEKELNEYWTKVSKTIDNRIIGGFKIPESFTKEVNGQKIVITPNDFFKYVSRATETDESGNKITGYQKDLNSLTAEEYLNREMLDAWLMFTGGTYKDLIAMAVNEDKVRQLRVKSKEQRTSKTVRVVKNNGGKTNINDIVLS